MRLRQIAFFVVLSLLALARLDGQSPNGTISGIVLDPAGGVIVGAEIVIANDATGVQYSAKTNGDGFYLVPNLPPGTYRLQVSKLGFKTLIKPDLVIHVQDALAINFTLPIGAISEIVTVQGGAPLINTENGAVSTVIDRKFVESLPLNGRSFNTLLQLTPGVVIAPAAPSHPGQFSISGQRTSANTFLVDGASANFGSGVGFGYQGNGTGTSQAFSVLGGTGSLVSVEALQEFRIETSSFAPEFGHGPGGQIILTTRSGTENLHGGMYEYFRNDVMDANDWFNNAAIPPIPKSAERHNDFGGFLGGPIFKEKTFFFFSYEGARLRLPQTLVIAVPSQYARTNAPAQLAPYLDAFPQPDDRTITSGTYTSRFTGSWSNSADLNATSVRIDHKIGSRFSIFGRYNNAPSQTIQRSNALSYLSPIHLDTQTLTLGVDTMLTSSISNTLRGNYSRQASLFTNKLDSFGGAVPVTASLFLGSLPSASNLAGFLLFDAKSYSVGLSARDRTTQAEILDDLSVVRGTHQFKFGAEYRAIYFHSQPYTSFVEFVSPSVQSFLSNGTVLLVTAANNPVRRLRTRSSSLYGQDIWKPNPRLTLTYGVRWEINPAPSALGNTTLASWTNVNNPAALALAPPGTPLWRTTYNSFAPRLGLAYQLKKDGSLVFRAGGGLFYDQGAASAGDLARNFPNSVFNFAPNVAVPLGNPSSFLPTISLQPPFPAFTAGYAPNLILPRSYQWNVALEKSLAGHQVISATYVGQAGTNLLRQQAIFRPNPNFLGDFLLTVNDARSSYDALQIQYRRPLLNGLQALLNYTWSHSLDNASNDAVAGFSDAVIPSANDHASSDFDVRHSFSGALDYAIPAVHKWRPLYLLTEGWSVDTVIAARTGFPFNALLLTVSPVPGGATHSRPDLVPGQPFYLYGTQCASVFQGLGVLSQGQSCPGGKGLNPAAFSVPPTIRQGTEGRNDIPGFGLTQVDLSIGRKFPLTDKLTLQFRVDAFNLLNHPNFANPSPTPDTDPPTLLSQQMLNQGLGGLNSLFQQGGPRSLQLSLKLSF